MKVCFTLEGKEICRLVHGTVVPRKEDLIMALGQSFIVKDVIWHLDTSYSWIEIKLNYN